MKFAYTILYVDDVSETVAFYKKAFGLQQRFIDSSGQYAEMETSATTLAFASNELARSNLPEGFQENSPTGLPAGMEISFVTDNVAEAFTNAVRVGATAVTIPKLKPWGQTVAYVRDLTGVLVAICSPVQSA